MRFIPRFAVFLFAAFFLFVGIAQAGPPSQAQDLIGELEQASSGTAKISKHSATGLVRYIGFNPENAIAQPNGIQAATAKEASDNFLTTYGGVFGLTDPRNQLKTVRTRTVNEKRSSVRYQQVHNEIPVMGAELIVNTHGLEKRILSANGEIVPNIKVSTSPAVDPGTAAEAALAMVAKHYQADFATLTITKPELQIYNPFILGIAQNKDHLVWRMEVGSNNGAPIRELVLIDAHSGMMVLHFNQVDTARNRQIYNCNYGSTAPGTPARSEGAPATGITDVDAAYDALGRTFNFYYTYNNRNSINGAGMALVAWVLYREDPYSPYQNAFWDGEKMVFGEGFVVDDVAAHELTHGVTDYESRLFYFYQSGAINEALSDIWGNFIDQVRGEDPSVRWLVGENLSIGALRDMKNPHAFDQPDSMLDTPYYVCSSGDNFGVHTNSGVLNKAAYLLTDGGSHRGYTVTKLSGGLGMVADLFYEVQTNLLTSASDYQDLGDAMLQAAANLGFSTADYQSVLKTVRATAMNQEPVGCAAVEAPSTCGTGEFKTILFSDNLENTSSGNWVKSAGDNYWFYPPTSNPYSFDATYASSGVQNFWAYDVETTSDSSIAMANSIALPTTGGSLFMHFKHAYNFEAGSVVYYDGGVLEYSTNGGSTWNDAGGFVVQNGYNGSLESGNPLGGRAAFCGQSNGYTSTLLDISSLAGSSVRFRFRLGTDSSGWAYGWFIDDISIYQCRSVPVSNKLFWRRNSDNRATLWVLDGNENKVSEIIKGPYAGWKPVSYHQNYDGTGNIIWDRTQDGVAQLWSVDGNGNILSQKFFGPFAGWRAVNYHRRMDGARRLLWSKPSTGEASLWTLDSTDTLVSKKAYGPIAGWSPVSYHDQLDGTARMLWVRASNGQAALMTLNASDSILKMKYFGPITDWIPTSYHQNEDGTSRLVWTKPSTGSVAVWKLDGSDNYLSRKFYGPLAGHTAVSYD